MVILFDIFNVFIVFQLLYSYLLFQILTSLLLKHNYNFEFDSKLPNLEMPPKKGKRNSKNQHSTIISQALVIEQHFSQDTDVDPVPQILKKIQIECKENHRCLNSSILCLFLRICGLQEMTAKIDANDFEQYLQELLQAISDTSFNSYNKRIIIINPKDELYSIYTQRIKQFLMKLLSNDFNFIKESKENKLLINMRNILEILCRNKIRPIRYASIELMRIIIECQTNLYSTLINQKQSRKAFQFSKDIQLYLKSIVKYRIKDIDSKIRESLHQIIKITFLTIENDLVDNELILELFQSSLIDQNNSIVQEALSILMYLFQKSNKIRACLINFAQRLSKKLQYLSIIPNRKGLLSLKFMIQVQKQQNQQNKLIKLDHIARLFQYYSLQNYSQGLFYVIQAFYNSIYRNSEDLLNNKNIVIIQILNLIGNYSNKNYIQQIIIKHFFQFSKIPCEKLINFNEIFIILIEQSYLYNGHYVQLREKDLLNLIFIINKYIQYVKKKIHRFQGTTQKNNEIQLSKWKDIGENFNNNLLTNIKVIIQEKIKNNMTKAYLQMMSQLVLPISSAYENYLDYMVQKMVSFFEIQSDPMVLKYIVSIFYNNQSHHISLLTDNLKEQSNEIQIMKKIAIMSKFYLKQSTNLQFTEQIIKAYKYIDDQRIKQQYLTGLFIIHQWFIMNNRLYQASTVILYQQIQQKILKFYFNLLSINESYNIKSTILTLLCQLFKIISHDKLIQCEEIYYIINQQQIKIMFKFLHNQVGLPNIDLENDQFTDNNDYTILINRMSIMNQSRQMLIAKMFQLFKDSHVLIQNQMVIQLICGALLTEKQEHDVVQNNISKMNLNISYERVNAMKSIYSKEQLASNFIKSLVKQEEQQKNQNKFVFWNFFEKIAKVYKNKEKTKEKLLNLCLQIYIKSKEFKKAQKKYINKALLFIISDVDRIFETKSFEQFQNTILILKKFNKKISYEAQTRILMFIKSKSQQSDQNQHFEDLIGFLSKSIKNYNKKNVKDEESDKDKSDNESQKSQVGEINERMLMRPTIKRITRSSIKKMEIEE